ncbi:hypothetical protein CEXT_831 [Caerostris extrusa]|uniref:Uncharacterized protein n=1 Tax=Caerostris extrusa TaxID=172846 RepID=A0AAV4SGJ7_CAEEX|nr:hypothetical protein CEXT_831 [Caerostris extrusa]
MISLECRLRINISFDGRLNIYKHTLLFFSTHLSHKVHPPSRGIDFCVIRRSIFLAHCPSRNGSLIPIHMEMKSGEPEIQWGQRAEVTDHRSRGDEKLMPCVRKEIESKYFNYSEGICLDDKSLYRVVRLQKASTAPCCTAPLNCAYSYDFVDPKQD